MLFIYKRKRPNTYNRNFLFKLIFFVFRNIFVVFLPITQIKSVVKRDRKKKKELYLIEVSFNVIGILNSINMKLYRGVWIQYFRK